MEPHGQDTGTPQGRYYILFSSLSTPGRWEKYLEVICVIEVIFMDQSLLNDWL